LSLLHTVPFRLSDNCAGGESMENELLRYERLAEDLGRHHRRRQSAPRRASAIGTATGARAARLSVSTVVQALHQLEDQGAGRSPATIRIFRSPCGSPLRAADRPHHPGSAGTGRCQPAPAARPPDRRPARGRAPGGRPALVRPDAARRPCGGSMGALRGAISTCSKAVATSTLTSRH
jgi:hypothetical protein